MSKLRQNNSIKLETFGFGWVMSSTWILGFLESPIDKIHLVHKFTRA